MKAVASTLVFEARPPRCFEGMVLEHKVRRPRSEGQWHTSHPSLDEMYATGLPPCVNTAPVATLSGAHISSVIFLIAGAMRKITDEMCAVTTNGFVQSSSESTGGEMSNFKLSKAVWCIPNQSKRLPFFSKSFSGAAISGPARSGE